MSQSMPPNYDERNREESISARVYREIKNKILQLDYLPGSYLTEARLAEEYGVSRMPVRIAIQKLSSVEQYGSGAVWLRYTVEQ